mmetsp:Transcript_38785/g.91203  ORF Transcript_38785/g.91203 Transcript_38785/m.91203 type:complete len:167 (-) Transcript_38785:185-685(-)|eukprot:CAMPEP_0178428154 /NCGR_PEP_ID=MMETSP0689_2-20121128/30125_1 /TAXON_ID=160604 /ORGANISM="Amphidinium massartii, Strain CS-259" /LENGTH=166 /DNA_ID=CAMNT_0020049905 /DNA_START=72 /DNA_END=572 /DNA_ORIENTATION=-
MNADLTTGDISSQWIWHETYRDAVKNQYRTAYMDMSNGRETAVKNNYPSGYGGHVPLLAFDVLFRNTSVDRKLALMKMNPSRDTLPDFQPQKDGIPGITKFPRGSRHNPTKGAIPSDGTTTFVRAPYGQQVVQREPPSHRTIPATLMRSRSAAAGLTIATSPSKAM